ncbi:hypothetical protein HRG84_11190, partial [Flavisolibacter sp. BT320]|nr:hypothetical protein [Flavisolibacter longurius]
MLPSGECRSLPVFYAKRTRIVVLIWFLLLAGGAQAQLCQNLIQNNTFTIEAPVCANSVAILRGSVPTIAGNLPFVYQWERAQGNCDNGNYQPIAGANGKDYVVPAGAIPAICYRRTVISGLCVDRSTATRVQGEDRKTPVPPVATVSQPDCQTKTGSITITSPAPAAGITYSINGTTYSNTTGIFKDLAPGFYPVTARHSSGCTSPVNNITITAFQGTPTGTISPATATLCPGSNITLTATGGTSYQWYRNGVKIDGATAATYAASEAGEYTADILTASCEGKASNSAVVTAGTAPTGTISPATATLCPGSTINLSVSGGTSYQWYRNGVKIDGATAATYAASEAGEYTADIITASCEGKASNSAVVTAGTAPTGTISPATATLCPGSNITLTATGGTSYQWYRNGVKIDGATAATYSASEAGEYTADIISGDCQGKSSNAATLTAGTAPTGTISPATATLCPGSTISLSVSGGTSYQWYRNGVKIDGATAATYAASEAGEYTADILTASCEGKASNSAVVSAGTAPTGTISPATATLCPGSNITLTATGGTSYQWYRNGVKIDGATAATYAASEAGEYTADIISGDCQGKSSNAATLTAGTAPTGT